ncbi:hypothetical protein CkaCkLH20_04732 [Colletotrichum karsti]|uniref:Uncharacterized protein n=1 Tax=Colletotrichum karsti TaxID=1095194 RepID=A0A9P6I8C8_9PEZI|nr:uncharacterized protein CkaCkLH20_04732 [Colletotrichum karsti]KAF9877597.1 hypothetical protein CkaCkLH20_04732 [Colletotrichum karsti]
MALPTLAVDVLRGFRSEFFKDEEERESVIRKAAQVAAKILHIHSDFVPEPALAKLAGDVGHKLRDFITKRTHDGLLYYTCQQDLNTVELATIVAFRSQFPCFDLEADFGMVQANIVKNRPLECGDLDSYLSRRLQDLGTHPCQDATIFQEDKPKILYWGSNHLIAVDEEEEASERLIKSIDKITVRLWEEMDMDITIYIMELYDEVRQQLARIKSENSNFSGKEEKTRSKYFDETDQVDIFCPLCRDSVPICTMEQTKRHCLAFGHNFLEVIEILEEKGRTLRAREFTSDEVKPPPMPTCPDCDDIAEWWDAIYLHNYKFHEGDLADKLHGFQLLGYLVWVGSREPLPCERCRESNGTNTTLLTVCVAEKHHVYEHMQN